MALNQFELANDAIRARLTDLESRVDTPLASVNGAQLFGDLQSQSVMFSR